MIPDVLALMQAHAPLVVRATGGIYDRPLKKLAPGILPTDDPMATPAAFSATAPFLLRPSVVVSPSAPRMDHGGTMPDGWAAMYLISVACYAHTGGEATLGLLAADVSRAILNKRVPVPQGGSGRVRTAHASIGPEVAPEYPNSGIVIIDTYRVSSVWRIP